MAEQEEDLSQLSLADRFSHKNWKVRKEAYEAASSEFKSARTENDAIVRQFANDSNLWKTAITDSNVACLQEAVVALVQFLDICGTQGCTRTRGVTIGPLAEKCLISTKPITKQKAQEAILLYVELDKADPVLEELLPLLSHKLPKVIAAVLSVLTSIYHDFGCKTVEPKSVLKQLPKVYGHADKNVRAEAQNLTLELYRYLRDGIKPLFWNELKPIQQQEMDKLFEKVAGEPVPKPPRLLRSQQARQAVAASAETAEVYDEDDEVDDGGEIDLTPESVDVFAKAPGKNSIPDDFQERINSTKWKDRKDVLDEVYLAINIPSVADGPFDDIVRGLAKSMKDANVAVVTVAANCVEALAKGLRKAFSKHRSTIMEPMMERLKERKQSVTDALAAALDAVASTVRLSDYLESTLEYLKHKNPLVKLEATRFLIRALKSSRDAPGLPEVKALSDSATKLLSDSTEVQRNAGAEILGVLLKIMGERIMTVHLEPLDDIRKGKVKEFADAAEVKAKYKPKAAAAPKPAAAAPPPGKKPMMKKKVVAAPVKQVAPPAADYSAPPTPARAAPPAHPTLAKPGTLRGLKPPGGLTAAKKLPQPAAARANAHSARPEVYSPPFEDDPAPQAPPPASRGLTGRQLNKPSQQQQQHSAAHHADAALPSLASIEMEEMRAELSRLRSHNERLAREATSLSTQVQELEDQNAQLIEDHTRDVLSIKAKETQLVRARSDAESAEQTAAQLQREVERLKRELGRTARASSPRVSDYDFASVPEGTAAYGLSKGEVDGDLRLTHNMSPLREGLIRANSAASNSSSQSPARKPARIGGPPQFAAPGRPPGKVGSNGGAVASAATSLGNGVGGGSTSRLAPPDAAGGQESWRRAAEVTQNLKARIEQMRQRQQATANR